MKGVVLLNYTASLETMLGRGRGFKKTELLKSLRRSKPLRGGSAEIFVPNNLNSRIKMWVVKKGDQRRIWEVIPRKSLFYGCCPMSIALFSPFSVLFGSNLHLGYFFCYFSERVIYFLLKKDSNIKVVCTFLRNFSMKFFRVYLLTVEHFSTFSVETKNREGKGGKYLEKEKG